MEGLFSLGLLVLLLLAIVVTVSAIRASARRRRGEEAPPEPATVDPQHRPPGAGPAGTTASPTEASAPPEAPHEYFMTMNPESGEEMKLRLYSLDEYGRELGGDENDARNRGFVAVLKAYRPVDDEWLDYPPERAAGVLRLAPERYEVDRERAVLLLRQLPHGLPASARDVL